jgi:hypothetical protein
MLIASSRNEPKSTTGNSSKHNTINNNNNNNNGNDINGGWWCWRLCSSMGIFLQFHVPFHANHWDRLEHLCALQIA